MNRKRARTTAALAIAGILLVGCAPAADEAESTPTPRPTPSPTPSPTQVYAVPEPVQGEIARLVHTPDGGEDDAPVTAMTTSDLVVAGEPFYVQGACVGGSLTWEVVRAAVGDSGDMLMGGSLECGDTVVRSSFESDYGGPVQVMLTSTDDVDEAYLIVLPADF